MDVQMKTGNTNTTNWTKTRPSNLKSLMDAALTRHKDSQLVASNWILTSFQPHKVTWDEHKDAIHDKDL